MLKKIDNIKILAIKTKLSNLNLITCTDKCLKVYLLR